MTGSSNEQLVTLAERLQGICLGAGLSVATAESCTGGLVASTITDIAGSSNYFRGAVVAYADQTKSELLDVPAEVLAAHGAVSAQVARAMATGARARLNVDLVASVTGIAGPGGGSDAKPVGLTYVAVADGADVVVKRFVWHGDRVANKRSSVAAALELLIERASTVVAASKQR